MPISRAAKERWVADFRRDAGEAACVVAFAPGALDAAETERLRRRMREGGARYRVVRNRLARLALEGTPQEPLSGLLSGGPRAVSMAPDPVEAGRAAVEFAREFEERLVVLGGMLEGRLVGAAEIRAVAELPPLDVLRARIVGALRGPGSSVARVLREPAARVARAASARGGAGSPGE